MLKSLAEAKQKAVLTATHLLKLNRQNFKPHWLSLSRPHKYPRHSSYPIFAYALGREGGGFNEWV